MDELTPDQQSRRELLQTIARMPVPKCLPGSMKAKDGIDWPDKWELWFRGDWADSCQAESGDTLGCLFESDEGARAVRNDDAMEEGDVKDCLDN